MLGTRGSHNPGFPRCQQNDRDCSPLGSIVNYKWHSVAILGSRRDDDLAGDGWGAGGERRRIVFKDRATPNFAADWKMRRKGRSQEEESDWGVWGEGGGEGREAKQIS